MSKYIFLNLTTKDGEREYSHETVHELPKDKDPNVWADEYCSEFWGVEPGEKEEGSDWYEFDGGAVMTKVKEVKEISVTDYNVLKKYL